MVKVDAKSLSMMMSLDPSERDVRRLFWRDDMENYNLCKWRGRHAGSTVAYVNNAPWLGAFEGDYVLRMARTDGDRAETEAYFGKIPDELVSLEVRWWKDFNLQGFRLAIDLYDQSRTPGVIRYANVQWFPNRWQVVTGAPEATRDVATEYICDDTWNILKMFVDFSKDTYALIESNGKIIDLRSQNIPIITSPSTIQDRTRLVLAPTLKIPGDPAYCDDVRFYIHEVI
jgi:hypothetical protein